MLFHIIELPSVKGSLLFLEVPVHAETAPYLVLSNKGFIWINSAFKGGFVRSALVRNAWKEDLPTLMLSAAKKVYERGKKMSWGNLFPNTDEGRKQAEAYLASYELPDPECLTHGTENPWIPEGCGVVVPKDRSYLGVMAFYGDESYTVLLHNPARGMVFLGDWEK